MSIKISGRNKLRGKIIELKIGDIMALVTVQVGEHIVDSVITRKSAEELNLQPGDEVAALKSNGSDDSQRIKIARTQAVLRGCLPCSFPEQEADRTFASSQSKSTNYS